MKKINSQSKNFQKNHDKFKRGKLYEQQLLGLINGIATPVCASGTAVLIGAGCWSAIRGQTSIARVLRSIGMEVYSNVNSVSKFIYRRAISIALICVIFIAHRMRRKLSEMGLFYAIYLNKILTRYVESTRRSGVA